MKFRGELDLENGEFVRFSFDNKGRCRVLYDSRFESLPSDSATLSMLIGNIHIALWSTLDWVNKILVNSHMIGEKLKKYLEEMPIDGKEVN